MQKNSPVRKILPFILSLVIILIDQASKQWVIDNIPLGSVYKSYFGDFLIIWHIRNTGAAFSMGASWGPFMRTLVFLIVPFIVIGFLGYAVWTDKSKFTAFQRWTGAMILGGGLGTMYDRVFRFNEGVVDFISIKFYGLFGMDRWPTFNISDSCVVVGVILFMISVLFQKEGK
ncbi:MAG: signal peptidase II [Sphaerochaetaceae bacterium]|nr:signal peptidase II [Sphaerochaetaceae bacterium]